MSTTTRSRSNRSRSRGRGSAKPTWTPKGIAITVGIVLVSAAILYAAFGMSADPGLPLEEVAGDPSVSGEPLPPFGDGPDPTLGSAAPVVSGADFDGTATTVGEGTELLVFLASWCPHCQAELPELVEWLEAGNLPEDVTLTAVVTGLDPQAPNWPPQDWLDDEGYTGPVLVDDADATVAAAYGMSGTPFWVALDDGEVVARVSGRLGMDQVAQLASAVSG